MAMIFITLSGMPRVVSPEHTVCSEARFWVILTANGKNQD